MHLAMLHEATWKRILGGGPSADDRPYELINPPPPIWYHGTSSVFYDTIMERGLEPLSDGWLYLTQNRKLALFSARRAVQQHGGYNIVLRVNLSGLGIDLEGTKLDSRTSSIIPPSNIKKVRTRRV